MGSCNVMSLIFTSSIYLLTFPLFLDSIPSYFLLDFVVPPEAEWVRGTVDSIVGPTAPSRITYLWRVLVSSSIQDPTGITADLDNAPFFSISIGASVHARNDFSCQHFFHHSHQRLSFLRHDPGRSTTKTAAGDPNMSSSS